MIIRINGKQVEEVLPPVQPQRVYSDAEGLTVMIVGFAIVAFLLKYWGWLW